MAGVTDLASAIGTAVLNQSRSSAIILPLDVNDRIRRSDCRAFQYFPATISDQKGINWQTKEIPGGSLPLYQWISSGARQISFTAVFTSDTDLLSQANLPSRIQQSGQNDRNVDIRAAAVWLRQFMLPSYGQQTQLGTPTTFAPNKLVLYLQNSGIGIAGGASAFETNDSIPCVMTQCDFDYTAFFPSGLPRVMTAQLSFAQIGQMKGAIAFPAAPTSNGDGTVSGEMQNYINGSGQTPPQAVPSGSAIPSQQTPASDSFGYRIQPKLVQQVISGTNISK